VAVWSVTFQEGREEPNNKEQEKACLDPELINTDEMKGQMVAAKKWNKQECRKSCYALNDNRPSLVVNPLSNANPSRQNHRDEPCVVCRREGRGPGGGSRSRR